MKTIFTALARLGCERGQMMAEYGILIAVIALVVAVEQRGLTVEI